MLFTLFATSPPVSATSPAVSLPNSYLLAPVPANGGSVYAIGCDTLGCGRDQQTSTSARASPWLSVHSSSATIIPVYVTVYGCGFEPFSSPNLNRGPWVFPSSQRGTVLLLAGSCVCRYSSRGMVRTSNKNEADLERTVQRRWWLKSHISCAANPPH